MRDHRCCLVNVVDGRISPIDADQLYRAPSNSDVVVVVVVLPSVEAKLDQRAPRQISCFNKSPTSLAARRQRVRIYSCVSAADAAHRVAGNAAAVAVQLICC